VLCHKYVLVYMVSRVVGLILRSVATILRAVGIAGRLFQE
jgi:hypothetical protein